MELSIRDNPREEDRVSAVNTGWVYLDSDPLKGGKKTDPEDIECRRWCFLLRRARHLFMRSRDMIVKYYYVYAYPSRKRTNEQRIGGGNSYLQLFKKRDLTTINLKTHF